MINNPEYLEAILNNIDEGYLLCDEKGKLISYNSRLLSIWRVPLQQSKNIFNITTFFEALGENNIWQPPKSIEHTVSNIKACSEQIVAEESTLITIDGRNIRQKIIPNVSGILIIFKDISSEVSAIQSNKILNDAISKIINQSPEATMIVKNNGDISHYNHHIVNLLCPKENSGSLGQMHVKQLIEDSLIKTDKNKSLVLNFIMSNGEPGALEVTVGFNAYSLHIIRLPDISKMIFFIPIYKKQTISTSQMRNALGSYYKETLLDFHNTTYEPIANILSISNIVLNKYIGDLNPKQKQYIQNIYSISENMSSYLTSKIELLTLKESMEEKLGNIELEMFINKIIYKNQYYINNKDLEIDIKNMNVTIESKYYKNISNLISIILNNVIHKSPDKSSIVLDTEIKGAKNNIIIKDQIYEDIFSQVNLSANIDLSIAYDISEFTKTKVTSTQGRKFRSTIIEI